MIEILLINHFFSSNFIAIVQEMFGFLFSLIYA